MNEVSEKELFIETEKIDMLMTNLSSSMPSTIFNSFILTGMLWSLVPKYKLLPWFLINTAFVLFRYGMVYLFRRGVQKGKYKLWKILMFVSFVIAGFMFSSSSIIFFEYISFEYLIFIYFILGGMVAGSVGSYHNNLSMYYGYSSSVFLLPTFLIFGLQGAVTTPMAIMGLLFYLISTVNANRLNRDLSEFLSLKYENMQLVNEAEKLNMELISKNETLKELALIDPLTKLRNRRYLYEVFIKEIATGIKNIWIDRDGSNKRLTSASRGYGVLLIDIDYFKNVNDKYGHDSGDLVLEAFSKKLSEIVRTNDVISRIGGEEFVIVLKDISDENIQLFAEKIRKQIESSLFEISNAKKISITCTIGFVSYPFFKNLEERLTFEQVLFLADKALYYGKKSGRNQSVKVVSSQSVTTDTKILNGIIEDLSGSIKSKQIEFTSIEP
jgi:diguanylate cyclase (GGDEF)-like protein